MSYKLIDLHSKEKTLVDRESSKYWNDETLEKNKAFNVIDLGFDKIEASDKYKALLDSMIQINHKHGIKIKNAKILSIASGSCWVESQLFKDSHFKSLTNVDISQHRIHKLAPFTMDHYGVHGDVSFLHGSVFDMDVLEGEFDIILMSQAFHHMEEPIRLLRSLKKMLTKGGCIIIAGEHFYTNYEYHKRAIKHFVKYLINWKNYRKLRNFYPSWQDLFQPDYDKGDIHWSSSEYEFLFRKAGFFRYHHDVHSSRLFQSFILKRDENYA
jgi:ubiquinone/menaquinone biosynthesis C-methylase UbiE